MYEDGLHVRGALADEVGGCDGALSDNDRTQGMVVSDIGVVRTQRVVECTMDELILSSISLQMSLLVRRQYTYSHAENQILKLRSDGRIRNIYRHVGNCWARRPDDESGISNRCTGLVPGLVSYEEDVREASQKSKMLFVCRTT